jgi:hypothetical protein
MTLTITSLRVDYRKSESPKPWPAVPYVIINCVFKCKRVDDYGEDFAWWQAKGESEEFTKVLTVDSPERYDAWLDDPNGWNFSSKNDGYGKAWIHNDPPWQYLPKFDVFWFRSWTADCSVTRAIIAELEYYKKYGKLPSVYRAVDSCVVLSHMRVLGETYWD